MAAPNVVNVSSIVGKTMGAALGTGEDMTPENIAANWESVSNMENAKECFSGPEQTIKILEQADK